MPNLLFMMWETIKSIFIIVYVYVGLFILLCWPTVLTTGLIAGVIYFVINPKKKKKNGKI